MSLRRKLVFDLLHGPDGGSQGGAVVAVVKFIEQGAVLADQGHLGGGGACVDAQVAAALVVLEGSGPDRGLFMPFLEIRVFLFVSEQGLQTLDLRIHPDTGPELLLQGGDADAGSLGPRLADDLRMLVRRDVHGRADGGEKMGVLRCDDMVVRQMQGPDKGLPQLRQEMQGPSQKGHVAPDGLSAGQAGDGLVDHGLEDGGGKVFPGGPLVDQGLDIGFCKHAASCGNGVDGLIVPGVVVQALGVGLQQGGHLIDKGTGASGADAVHALVDASGEIDDLGVLASQLDGHIALGRVILERGRNCNHLLDKGNLQVPGNAQAAGAGDGRAEHHLAQLFLCFGKQVRQGVLDIGKMPAVFGEKYLSFLRQNGDLDGGGSDVDAEAQRRSGVLGCIRHLRLLSLIVRFRSQIICHCHTF